MARDVEVDGVNRGLLQSTYRTLINAKNHSADTGTPACPPVGCAYTSAHWICTRNVDQRQSQARAEGNGRRSATVTWQCKISQDMPASYRQPAPRDPAIAVRLFCAIYRLIYGLVEALFCIILFLWRTAVTRSSTDADKPARRV